MEKIKQFLEEYTNTFAFSGNIGVRIGEDEHYYSFGDSSIEFDVNNVLKTKFKIWSITKQFVAALVLLLEQEGKLSTMATLEELFPNRLITNPNITVKQLLNHTSGIKNYSEFENSHHEFQRHDHNKEDLIQLFLSNELDFEPGSSFNYSNSGYYLLGCIIESVTDKRLAQVLNEKILIPFNLNETGFVSDNNIIKDLANGYYLNGESLIHCEYINMNLMSASGGLYSTTTDLIKWDQLLHSGQVLSQQSYQKMITSAQNNYGLGLFVEDDVIDHSGSCEGFISLLRRNTSLDTTIVILSNLGFTNNYKIATMIEKLISGEKVIVEKPKFVEIEIFDSNYYGIYQDDDDKVEIIRRDNKIAVILDDKYVLETLPTSSNTLHHTWIDEGYEVEIEEGKPSMWGMPKL